MSVQSDNVLKSVIKFYGETILQKNGATGEGPDYGFVINPYRTNVENRVSS